MTFAVIHIRESPMTNRSKTIIIGSGAAGLSLALSCADKTDVTIITHGINDSSATYYAQGGIAAALDEKDIILHTNDTVKAGDDHCNNQTAQEIISSGKEAINWLINQGVNFKKNNNNLDAKLESGHSQKRVFHITDRTGFYIWQQLAKNAKQHPNIKIMEKYYAFELSTTNNSCHGVYVINKDKIELLIADNIILATGGGSGLYLKNTSKYDAKGSGIAMAYNAGCRVANLEFVQFHPTILHSDKLTSPLLLTETLRGMGAQLKLPNNEKFMHLYSEKKELSTRDVVSLAIFSEMEKNNLSHVLLDVSNIKNISLNQSFPYIYQSCLKVGIDISQQSIPITPAAHYTCGGIITNYFGKTDITNLYAIGETACTGLHGANRLGSNSLLECISMGLSLSKNIKTTHQKLKQTPCNKFSQNTKEFKPDFKEIKQIMWQLVGIKRSNKGLNRAIIKLNNLQQRLNTMLQTCKLNEDVLSYKNFLTLAKITASSAISRKESRGCHFNIDFPTKDPTLSQKYIIQQLVSNKPLIKYEANPTVK
jgi:L-aspartate oxidase